MDNTDSTKPQQTGGLKLMTVFIAVLALHVLVIGGFTVYHLMGSSGGDADMTLDKNHSLKADGTVVADAATAAAAANDKNADANTPATTTPAESANTPATTTTTPATTPETTPAVTPTSEPAPAAPSAVVANPPAPASTENNPSTPGKTDATTPLVISSEDLKTPAIAPGLAPPPEPTFGSSPAPVATTHAPTPIAPVAVAPAPAPLKPAVTPTPTIASAPALTPVPEPAPSMTSAPSGPIMAPGQVASGPVHMPAVAPKPKTTPSVASTEEHAAAPMHEAKKETYVVKMTDSFKKIATAHHVTVAQLKEANHIKDNVLHTGEKLVIPSEKTLLAKKESAPAIGTPTRVVLNDESSTASLSASPNEHHHHFYTVTKGDTLKYIAKKFNVTTVAIKEANNLNDSKLKVGEKLRIPSKEARSASTFTPEPIQPRAASVMQPAPAPAPQPEPMVSEPAPVVEQPVSQPSPVGNPELANLTF